VSIRIMSAVFESKTLGPTERLVMLALADHADDEGKCYPSILRLCERTGLSERAVQTNVKKLTEAGYLAVHIGGGKGNANLYFVSPNPAANAPRTKCTPAPDAPQTPHDVRPNPAPDAPEPSGNIKEPSIEAAPRRRRKPEVAIPEGWVPNERNIADARERGFSAWEIEDEADKFRNHHTARGSLFRDWDAAWRTWLGKARQFQGRSVAGQAKTFGRGPGRSMASIVAERRLSGAHD
jgi:biotin operon repressor